MVVLKFPDRRSGDADPEALQRSRVLGAFSEVVASARGDGWVIDVVNRFGFGPVDLNHGPGEDRWDMSLRFVHPTDPFGIAVLVDVDGPTGKVTPEWCEVFVYDESGMDTPDVFSGVEREPLLLQEDVSALPNLLRTHRGGVAVGLLERWSATDPEPRNTRAVTRYLDLRRAR